LYVNPSSFNDLPDEGKIDSEMSGKAWKAGALAVSIAGGGSKLLITLKTCKLALLAVWAVAIPAEAGSIAITYSLSGTGTVVGSTATTLSLDAQASGVIHSANPALNAAWNPVAYSDESVLDFTTNLLHGSFILTLQDGDTLVGTVDEDQSAPDASANGTGPFTQTLTFTGGTGQFSGASGSVSGKGFLGTTDFSVSGSGSIKTSPVPEPPLSALSLPGLLLLMLGGGFRTGQKRLPG
jgi:hypothetical protein